jgi:hypothetical protein
MFLPSAPSQSGKGTYPIKELLLAIALCDRASDAVLPTIADASNGAVAADVTEDGSVDLHRAVLILIYVDPKRDYVPNAWGARQARGDDRNIERPIPAVLDDPELLLPDALGDSIPNCIQDRRPRGTEEVIALNAIQDTVPNDKMDWPLGRDLMPDPGVEGDAAEGQITVAEVRHRDLGQVGDVPDGLL